MQIKPIGQAYGAETQGNVIIISGGTTCGNNSLLLATNGGNISACIWIYPKNDGSSKYSDADVKSVVIPRYGMMILEKKKSEFVGVSQLTVPSMINELGGQKKTNVSFTPIAHT